MKASGGPSNGLVDPTNMLATFVGKIAKSIIEEFTPVKTSKPTADEEGSPPPPDKNKATFDKFDGIQSVTVRRKEDSTIAAAAAKEEKSAEGDGKPRIYRSPTKDARDPSIEP